MLMSHLKYSATSGHLLYGPNGHLAHTCPAGTCSDPIMYEFQLREHRTVAPSLPVEWVFSKPAANQLSMKTASTGSYGYGHMFAVFAAIDLQGRTLEFSRSFTTTAANSYWCSIYDGAFDRSSMTDFPDGSFRISKGNGELQRFEILNTNDSWTSKTFSINSDLGSALGCVSLIWQYGNGNKGEDVGLVIQEPKITDGSTTTYFEWDESTITMEQTGTPNDYGEAGVMEVPP